MRDVLQDNELEFEDEGSLNSPTCIACGWHPEDEGHDEDCPLAASDEPEPYNDQEEPDYTTDDQDDFQESLERYLRYPNP